MSTRPATCPAPRQPAARLCLAALALSCSIAAPTRAATQETIVLVRHGEKPDLGLGQLSCRGLNRALALPPVLRRLFGRPDVIFAPDPAGKKIDHKLPYDYIRPLATIEPAAIAFGLPVNTSLKVQETDGLARALQAPAQHSALVVVAWEHVGIVTLARSLLTTLGGTASDVPDWPKGDFDSIYVLRIAWDGQHGAPRFSREREGLDGRPLTCPEQPPA